MQERDEALDFIYKGWREGRQQRRNVMNQRGADRIAARRAMMERIGSSQLPKQRRSPPPQQNEVASTPPSSAPEQTSSTSVGNFTDDIATPDDESTPQIEGITRLKTPEEQRQFIEQGEVVSTPPKPMNTETAMATMDRFMGGTGATQSTYNPTSPKPTQANVPQAPERMDIPQDPRGLIYDPTETSTETPSAPMTLDNAKGLLNPKPEAEKTEPQRRNLGEAGDIIDGKIPYNLDGERIPERPKPKGMKETPYKAPYERPKDSRTNISEYGEPPKKPYEKPEMPFMKPSVEGYKKTPITRLKPDGGSGEAVPEKTATLTPVKRLKPVEQQHKESFETAWKEVENEANQPEIPDEIDFNETPTPEELVSQHVEDRKNKKLEELEQRAADRANDESLSDDKRDVAKLRQQMIAAMKEGKSKEEIDAMVQGSNLVGGDLNINGEKVQLDEDGNYTSPDGSIKITGNKKKTKTPKPDKTVSQAAKKTIKPAKEKATKKGKDAVRAASERLANAGMTGKKSEEPKKPEKAADKKKQKSERKKQDLTGIEKPKDSDLRRSADQQMLADVLLKKIPVADLRMFDRMLGGGNQPPVLVDEMGFITQAQAVDPAHVMMAGISDNPNPFETDIDPRLSFDLSRLKIKNPPTRFPGVPAMTTSRKNLLEEMTFVPTKRVPKLDDKGKKIPTGEKNKFGNPTYEMESVEDEDIGFFIRDGKNKRRMTSKEAAEILDSRKKAKSQPQVKIDLASPYWSENQWNIPITSAGKTSTLPDVFGMMQTSVGADPNDKSHVPSQFIPDPRRSSLADWSELKEITSISPADFKRRIKGAKDNEVRIGDALYRLPYLKDIADSMKPSDMANEDLVLTSMKNAPLFIAGRGVKRYDEEPSYFETILAPYVDDMSNRHELLGNEYRWESMNDLFE